MAKLVLSGKRCKNKILPVQWPKSVNQVILDHHQVTGKIYLSVIPFILIKYEKNDLYRVTVIWPDKKSRRPLPRHEKNLWQIAVYPLASLNEVFLHSCLDHRC
jgi:hypothetical protein